MLKSICGTNAKLAIRENSMFASKKKIIRQYLQSVSDADRTGFDLLLLDYLDGTMKDNLEYMGITKIEIHIDWHDHMKCIGVQGKYQNYYLDLQIYPDEFTVAFDLDEADEDEVHPLNNREQVYHILSHTISNLQ